jgi:hypothetical protein
MKFKHLLAFGLGLVAGCGNDGTDPLVLQGGGNYTYEAYSPSGTRVLQGIVHLEWVYTADGRIADEPLTGTWQIGWVPGAPQDLKVGPQVGSGTLEGFFGDDGLELDLNPMNNDDNVYLHAVVDGNTIQGSWIWSTLAGPTTQGRFTAVPGR